jgi:hypothetical protein
MLGYLVPNLYESNTGVPRAIGCGSNLDFAEYWRDCSHHVGMLEGQAEKYNWVRGCTFMIRIDYKMSRSRLLLMNRHAD